jgi:hypothetical protein
MVEPVPVHVDEPAWIASSYYFDLLVRGDVRHPDWSLMTARDSPPIGKYLFGAALRAAGHPVETIDPLAAWQERYRTLPGGWGTGQAAERRAAVAARLSPDVRAAIARGWYDPFAKGPELTVCRGVVFAFGILSASLVAAIGLTIRGPVTGLIAGLVYAGHPLVLMGSSLALFDMIAVAFSAMAAWCLAGLMAEDLSRGRRVALGLLGGVSVALAVGTKMNALIVAFLAAFTLLVLACRADTRRSALSLGLGLLLGLFLFVGMDPACYSDPLGALRDLVAIPAETTRVQAGFLPDYLPSLKERFAVLSRFVCGHVGVMIGLCLAALVATWYALKRPGPRLVTVAWFWLALGLVGLWLPFPWERYALPVVPPAALVLADALVGVVAACWIWTRSGRQGSRQPTKALDARAR